MPSPQANDTPWWFHPGSQMRLCFTPKRNHSIMTQCSVRGILAFRRGVEKKCMVAKTRIAPTCLSIGTVFPVNVAHAYTLVVLENSNVTKLASTQYLSV